MNKKTILCIIDMQSRFANHEYALEGTLKEIFLAKRRNHPVLLVAYGQWGYQDSKLPSDFEYAVPEIEKVLSHSNLNIIRVVKFRDNGGDEIKKALVQARINPDEYKYRLAGVNRCYCIEGTANGMQDWNADLEIAWHATGCFKDIYCGVDHENELPRLIMNNRGIKVITNEIR